MAKVNIKMGNRRFVLTDEHAACSYGQPLLIDEHGTIFGPWDSAIDNPNAKMPGGETMHWQITARAIAAYARDDNPDDADVLDLVKRFESLPEPPSRRGRKPIPEAERKTARVELRVHPDTKAAWQAKAAAAGFDDLAPWIESTLNQA